MNGRTMARRALILALAAVGATSLSCNVNEYCVSCADPDGGGGGDGGGGDGPIDADDGDGGDACTPTGAEVCNDLDDDCDGQTDEDVADVGMACGSDTGECTMGVYACTAGELRCSGTPAAPETCNNLDDNCNGTADEGNPGGGLPCGSDLGECQAGITVCSNGVLDCQGDVGTPGQNPEICDGRDNDCDNAFDEGLPPLGSCGATGTGECELGVLTCVGGSPVCVGEVGPTLEVCDALDQDCDGNPTNGFNLGTDPRNCGMCNRICTLDFATEGCSGGTCTVASCDPGHVNIDGMAANGCEYACTFQGTQEACNQQDEDCDGQIDEDLIAPNICDPDGACAGTVATCTTGGWDCTYGPNVSVDGNGDIVPESRCDNIDNDCDGRVDEGHPTKGQACGDMGVGVCRGTGTFVCDPGDPTGAVVCNITTPGQTASAELCDNLDNNCNGMVDDNAAQDFVSIGGGRQVMRWEASRPDATAAAQGTVTARACSKTGVQPWTNVRYGEARAACQAIGADLCTEQDWHRACSVVTKSTFPVAGPAASPAVTFIEAEDYYALTPGTFGGVARTWVPDRAPVGYSGISALRASPNTGASPTRAEAATGSPRLDYQVNFATTADYYVWVRIYGPTNSDDDLHVGIGTTPGTPTITIDASINNNWEWRRAGPFAGVVAGNRIVSLWMSADGTKVDAIAITRSTSTTAPTIAGFPFTAGGTWSYATTPSTYQLGVCNEDDYDTDGALAGDQDDLLVGGNRASCYANWGAAPARINDLSGNAKEWTLARLPGVNPIRGGASNNEGNGITCGLSFTLADNDFFFPNVGFRCCR